MNAATIIPKLIQIIMVLSFDTTPHPQYRSHISVNFSDIGICQTCVTQQKSRRAYSAATRGPGVCIPAPERFLDS